jgi:hypothetical protein
MKTFIAAAVLAAAIASPAFGQSSELLTPPAAQSAFGQVRAGAPVAASPYRAYNAVTPFGSPTKATGPARDTAIRACSAAASTFKENTWGSMQIQQYRSCMAQHGQAE